MTGYVLQNTLASILLSILNYSSTVLKDSIKIIRTENFTQNIPEKEKCSMMWQNNISERNHLFLQTADSIF